MIKKELYIIVLMISMMSFAQQDIHYTQYMYNMNIINPAYAGSKNTIVSTLMYRNQWTNFEGSPETQTFSIHSPFKDKKIGLGLSLINDKLGPVREQNVFVDFSYTINTSEKTKLAFGLKSGLTFHKVGLSSLFIIDVNDPFFNRDINNTFPNFGVGMFFYHQKWYVGLSIPNFIKSVHLEKNTDFYGSEVNHYFGTFGYVFNLNDDWELKPSSIVKSAFDSPLSFDLNLNARYKQRLEFGASYRWDDSVSGLINYRLSERLHIGYAYDRIRSELKIATNSSHEVFIIYEFDRKSEIVSEKSPRFF